MPRKSAAGVAIGVLTLLGGAAAFRALAPSRYGLPEIEVSAPGPTGVRVDGGALFGNYHPAAGEGPHPAVLLLGGSEGGLSRGVQQMALALQREGFSVLQLGYFGVPGTPDSLQRIPLEVFDRGLAWLSAQPGVDARRLAVVGASKGAEAALLTATRHAGLRAVVAGMPTSVVWSGIDWRRGGQSRRSSWTSRGIELVTMPFSPWRPADGVISVYRSIEDPTRHEMAERAAIPIERVRAAVLLVCGEAETMWPACPMSRALATRAARRGGPPVEVLAYREAGHLVFGPPVPRGHPFHDRLALYGGTIDGNAAARADSWPRVVAFLRQR